MGGNGYAILRPDVLRMLPEPRGACRECGAAHRPGTPHQRAPVPASRLGAVADHAIGPVSPVTGGYCTDPACRCPNHALLDTRMLAVYGISERALAATEAALVTRLLPPGMLVGRKELARALWPEGDDAQLLDYALHYVRVVVNRARPKLPPFGWRVETVLGRGYRLVPTRGPAGD